MRKLVLAIGTALSVAAAESLDELTDSRGGGITPWVVGHPGEVFSVGGTQTENVTVRRIADIRISVDYGAEGWWVVDRISGRRVFVPLFVGYNYTYCSSARNYRDPVLGIYPCRMEGAIFGNKLRLTKGGGSFIRRVYKINENLGLVVYYYKSGGFCDVQRLDVIKMFFYYPREDGMYLDVVESHPADYTGVSDGWELAYLRYAGLVFYVREAEGHARIVKAELGNTPVVDVNRIKSIEVFRVYNAGTDCGLDY